MLSGAEFSKNKKHRFVLWRMWHVLKPSCCFVMLNPSLADDKSDDPTIKRCISFAANWGYGGIYVVNIYSYITPYPSLIKMSKGEQKANSKYLEKAFNECDKIIFAWGNYSIDKNIKYNILEYLKIQGKIPYCLKHNKNGSPAHPLYLKGDLKPIMYYEYEREGSNEITIQ